MDILQQAKKLYYVYQIRDVDTKEITYVGKGYGGRAWVVHRYGQDKLKAYLLSMLCRGYTPEQYVEIVARGLTNEDAKKIESELIAELQPLYNSVGGRVVLSVEQVQEAQRLREQGLSYAKISAKLGVGTMPVYRALSGRPGYVQLLKGVA